MIMYLGGKEGRMRLLTYYAYSVYISKEGRKARALLYCILILQYTVPVRVYICYSTGTGIIGAVYMQVYTGPEMKGHCV